MIGKTIGRYEIVAKLGQGGMGVVWRARDPLLDRDVALKLLPENMAQSPDARRRFLREAKAASNLHHPGIAAVFDAGEDAGRYYLAIQFVPGETLTSRLERGSLGVKESLRVALGTAEALAHAHGKGVLHRDITTNNIMVGQDGSVTLVDFGLALIDDHTRLTMSRASLGTAGFMAPEMVLGEDATPGTDVYSLGVVLYKVLTGALPFESPRIEEQLRATVSEPPRPPGERIARIPPAVDALVLEMLAKPPADRPSGDELLSRLRELLDDAPAAEEGLTTAALTAPLPSTPSPPAARRDTPGRGNRSRRLIAAGAIGLAIAVAWIGRGVVHSPPATVAVVPFQLGEDPEQGRWLREVIGTELTTRLSRLSGLRVVPWEQSRRHDDLGQWERIAEELGADALVAGRCEVIGRAVRGTAYVIDPHSAFQTWAYTLSGPLENVSADLDSMALGIADGLLGDLQPADRSRLTSSSPIPVDALRWYGQGLLAAADGLDDEARQWYERAVQRDSTFVPPLVAVADLHLRRHQKNPQDERALEGAESALHRAMRLDPGSLEAQERLAEIARRREQR